MMSAQERWHHRTGPVLGPLEGLCGPAHEPAQTGLSNPLLFDDLVISIDDSAPDLRATAHRQAAQARMLPLPCLQKAGHQPQPQATTQLLRGDRELLGK